MRILLALHQSLDPGYGASGATLSMGAALQLLGCSVEYFAFDQAYAGREIPGGAWATLRYPWRLARFLRRRASDFDVLDITTGDNWIWDFLRRTGAKLPHALITRSHGLEHGCNQEIRSSLVARGRTVGWKFPIYWSGYREWEVRQSLLRADMNILLNDTDRDFACAELGVPASKIAVLPNGIAPEFLRTAEPRNSDGGRLKLAFVGSWIDRKGISALVEALRLLEASRLDYQLTIYGARVAEDSVLNMFDSHLRDRVKVVVGYEHTLLPSLLADDEILMFPSRFEGFSLALTEGMACGLAPIATPVGGAIQLIVPGVNGLLIPVGDASALAAAVSRLAVDRSALLAMRRAARVTAMEYGWDRIARQTLALYEAVLSARSTGKLCRAIP
jgi:glycosyltransferase involved in cell wall biosynthesis